MSSTSSNNPADVSLPSSPSLPPSSSVLSKPKRPLSAFNLFYRFKRQKVIDLDNPNKDDITRIVQTLPGLEDCYTPSPPADATPSEVNVIRATNIRTDMQNNLCPRDTRTRRHRKNKSGMNGGVSFLELGRLMNAAWHSCDAYAKSIFNSLADEGRELYRQRMVEYRAATPHDAEAMKAKYLPLPNTKSSKKTTAIVSPVMAEARPTLNHQAYYYNNMMQQHMFGVGGGSAGRSPRDMFSNQNMTQAYMMNHPQVIPQESSNKRRHSPSRSDHEEQMMKMLDERKRLEEELEATKLRLRIRELEALLDSKRTDDVVPQQQQQQQQQQLPASSSRKEDRLSWLASAAVQRGGMVEHVSKRQRLE